MKGNDKDYPIRSLEDRSVGLHKSDITFTLNDEYIFIKMEGRKKYLTAFKGINILETKDHVTLRCKEGYCQSFLKVDVLLGGYKVDKPKNI